MISVRQGLRKCKYKDKHKDKYKNNRQTYDVLCFWKGDDNRSLIMKNMQNMRIMQNMRNMQNMQNIPHCFSRRKTKNLSSLNQN